ncbi:MAG: septal ring lytic transglycosylase RlpA family protein [Nitrosomonas sp.]|nr:septal ring lytic transglycosylase RlpA family protein [Nitrosomonas sp.]MCW5607899.1 septal ring lytic transglycosylase RlpA family protein [Nitrosomonas sp.]
MNKRLTFRNILPSPSTVITKVIVPLVFFSLSGCASTSQFNTDQFEAAGASNQKIATQTGGYYLDDGPGDNPPDNLDAIPDAVPKYEPLREINMRPYEALGKSFTPMTSLQPYKKRGTASWYGRRYHGNPTASGEPYDMYKMTAAHPTLPLPSYVRVTNTDNGKSVVVRVNDRGPFLSDRLIDLSYTAAHKLDIIEGGSGKVIVESIMPNEYRNLQVAAASSARKPIIDNGQSATVSTYLQLGAFGTAHNARNYLAHIQQRLPSLGKTIGIRKKDGLFKVHAGPYTNLAMAQQAANTFQRRLSIKPVMIID